MIAQKNSYSASLEVKEGVMLQLYYFKMES